MAKGAGKSRDDVDDEARLSRAEEIVGHRFKDRSLLRRALTHPSVMSGTDSTARDGIYERMEFLGDAILGFLIADEIYRRFPDMREGGMTRIRVDLIAGAVQSEVARDLGLADVLIIGRSERGTGGRGLTRALENAYEAITAAVYLDAGLRAARSWVLRTMGPRITQSAAFSPRNPKSALQELIQTEGDTPIYVDLGHEGPPHSRTFSVAVESGGERLGVGSGRTKRDAEAAAAAAALANLKKPSKRRRQQGS